MVRIRLVTVEGCPGAGCPACAVAEATLQKVLALAGIPLPEHAEGSRGEAHLADGRTIEAVHLSCDDAGVAGLDPARAPFLFVDDAPVLDGAELDPSELAEAVFAALFPDGLAGLRP